MREWHILYTGRLDRRVLVRERPWNVVWLFAAECVVLGILWARTGLLYGNGRDLAVSGLGAERGLVGVVGSGVRSCVVLGVVAAVASSSSVVPSVSKSSSESDTRSSPRLSPSLDCTMGGKGSRYLEMLAAFRDAWSWLRTAPMAASDDWPASVVSPAPDHVRSDGRTKGRSSASFDFFSRTLPNSGNAGRGVIVSSSSRLEGSFLVYLVTMLCQGFLDWGLGTTGESVS